jgi:hypothetical protein
MCITIIKKTSSIGRAGANPANHAHNLNTYIYCSCSEMAQQNRGYSFWLPVLKRSRFWRRRRRSVREMMRSPASERSLIIHSDDDDDARSGHDVEEPEQDSDSDSSSSSSSCATPRRGPSSPPYIQQWPQSYRSRRFLVPSSLVIMLEEESLVALPASQYLCVPSRILSFSSLIRCII